MKKLKISFDLKELLKLYSLAPETKGSKALRLARIYKMVNHQSKVETANQKLTSKLQDMN